MIENFPTSVPVPHRQFLENLVQVLRGDRRIVGVAAGGSYLTNSMDEYSDLDLVIAIEPRDYAEVMEDRRLIAASIGRLLAAFTGEHVGESRLLICLYEQPLMHVDLKFVELGSVARRVEEPILLWDRDDRFSSALAQGRPDYPAPDPRWIEDRFWVWVHYVATKIGRGELFEALDSLAFLRKVVLGPLGVSGAGGRPAGVRRIETVAPAFANEMRGTVAHHDATDCVRALHVCIRMYRSLRPAASEIESGGDAEGVAMEYLRQMEQRVDLTAE